MARDIMKHAYEGDIEMVRAIIGKEVPVFNQVNELLAVGGLAVSIENSDGEQIFARHRAADQPYSIAQMSDGERNAVIIAANVLTVEPGTVLLIDEPERHLHRSIIEPFLSALFQLRTDCSFVVSTHETELPMANPDACVVVVRSCQWANGTASAWNVEILDKGFELPDDLKRSILGSRKRILFVEGQTDKLDQRLYEALFPEISVVSKGSCNDVISAVRGLRRSTDHHRVEAFGLIDKDFWHDAHLAKLAEQGVFALQVCAVESLYYCSDAIKAVARHQGEYLSLNAQHLIQSGIQHALDAIDENPALAERMAARRCERIVRDSIREQMPDWKAIQASKGAETIICVTSPFHEELATFNSLADERKLDEIIARYPIRESNVFGAIVNALRIDQEHYERLLPTLVRKDSNLAEKLRQRIQSLTDAIGRKDRDSASSE